MDKFKVFTILLSMLSLALLLIVIFGGKETVYVCYDKTEKENAKDCPGAPPLLITKKAADAAISAYSASFAHSRPGVVANVINVYSVNSSYHSDVTFSNAKTNEFHEVTFNIDGKTSSVTCITGCEYMESSLPQANESAGTVPENVVVAS